MNGSELETAYKRALERSRGVRRFVRVNGAVLVGRLGWWTEGVRRPSTITCEGLPIDAVLVDADMDHERDCARLWFTHPSFSAGDPPEIPITMQVVERKKK